jgi:hypothetical protein
MNLAQAIQARWSAAPQLNGLLPAEEVVTGTYFAAEPGGCYATITLPGGTVEGYANDGSSVENVQVRIQVHDDDYGHGQAVVAALLAALDRADFALAGADRVLAMQKTGMPQEIQDPRRGQWEWIVDFRCRVYLAGAASSAADADAAHDRRSRLRGRAPDQSST